MKTTLDVTCCGPWARLRFSSSRRIVMLTQERLQRIGPPKEMSHQPARLLDPIDASTTKPIFGIRPKNVRIDPQSPAEGGVVSVIFDEDDGHLFDSETEDALVLGYFEAIVIASIVQSGKTVD